MPNHLDSYLKLVEKVSPDAIPSISETVDEIIPEQIEPFSHKEHIKGLLLGQVQSGKTGQMLGIIAAAADTDEGFSVFVLLTSDISALQQQTYKRALALSSTFNVCDENDEMRFLEVGNRMPSLVILKKNSRILHKWRNILTSSGHLTGRPIFVVDDEADAASLNTLVNKQEQSAINAHLSAILNLSTSSFFLQVTATPQSIFLQSDESKWRPSFVHYFAPGKGYLGGEFFYSKPKPFTNRTTDDDELTILLDTDEMADGLKLAIETYLVTCAHLMISKDTDVCNFLVHPSVRIDDHEKIKTKVESFLKYIFKNLDNEIVKKRLKDSWNDLQTSKPDLRSFREVMEYLHRKPEITVYTVNSGPQSNSRLTFDQGLNVVIGGNSLGRGVTFKRLQTVYYCRSAKSPQADTFWQHCRMFGYDRDALLMRVFMPEALFNMFSEINASNEVLSKEIEDKRFNEIQIVTTGKFRPTRRSVIDQSKYSFIVGGVNYFPPSPDQTNQIEADKVLASYDHNKSMHDITIEEAVKILACFKPDPANDWSIINYVNALLALKAHRDSLNLVKLIVRRNRNISRGTGTLLSPIDRDLGVDIENLPVITVYRLTGDTTLGWNGKPFWIPNIKLPSGKVFHRVD